jgi:hypothetical protein
MGPNYVLAKGYVVDVGSTNVIAGRAAVQTTTNTSVTTAGASADVLGVYVNDTPDAAKIATGKLTMAVQLLGIVRCTAGAAVAKRARLTTDSTGRAITKAQAGAGVQPGITFGIALTPASAAGDSIDVLLTPGATF